MKDIKPRNEKGKPHGLWIWYGNEDNPYCMRYYVNNRLSGYEEYYNFMYRRLTLTFNL